MKTTAAWVFALVMLATAGLHVYWALGGTWFLATALNMDIEQIPKNLVAITWVFVGCMLAAAVGSFWRAEILRSPLPQKLLAAGFWICALVLLAGAVFNFLIPRFWDRWVFAPAFLALALLSLALALPTKRMESPTTPR